MPSGDRDWLGEFRRLLEETPLGETPKTPEAPPELPADVLRKFWEENPEAHQAILNGRRNPFTGEITGGQIYERQEVDYQSYGPAYFPSKSGSFLDNLLAEMKRNPEWKEHHEVKENR